MALPPTAASACRATVSFVVAVEHLLDFVREHRVEIIRNLDCPARKPNRFTFRAGGASSGTILTSGLPSLAMMKPSPFAALSTSRDRCCLGFVRYRRCACRGLLDKTTQRWLHHRPGASSVQISSAPPAGPSAPCRHSSPVASPFSNATAPLTTVAAMPSAFCTRRRAPPGRSCSTFGRQRPDARFVEHDEIGGVAGADAGRDRAVPRPRRCRRSACARPLRA